MDSAVEARDTVVEANSAYVKTSLSTKILFLLKFLCTKDIKEAFCSGT